MVKFTVLVVYVDRDGKQVGAKLEHQTRTIDVPVNSLVKYKGRLTNADVTVYGLRAKPNQTIPRQVLKRAAGVPVATYILMHRETEVCRVYADLGLVDIVDKRFLPLALRREVLTVEDFNVWLNKRVDNLSRTYMNRIYIARKVGRDREKILRDSAAVSIIDNYWVKRSDVDTSWDELKHKRDINLELVNTALTGQIKSLDFERVHEDTTTLYTVKGAFPKAIYKGYMLKKDNNAVYEAVAYKIGSHLGIKIAEAVEVNSTGLVQMTLFTSEKLSMAHAGDFLPYTDYDLDSDEHRAIYEYFEAQQNKGITLELERLYLLNYLLINTDFHYENFGLMYSPDTMKVLSVAPAYDFNNAFESYNDPKVYYPWILNNLSKFLNNHPDIRNKLESPDFKKIISQLPYLEPEQKEAINTRIDYLLSI